MKQLTAAMTKRKEDTASFVLRFTQKIFDDEQGDAQIQWRGNIRHVQGGDESRFSEFEEVVQFIQAKLQNLTIEAMQDKTPEEQKGILSKSYSLWKKMALSYPKRMIETIKDPKQQVEQIQQQLSEVGETIGQKLEIDSWRTSSKADLKMVVDMIEKLTNKVENLDNKVEKLSKK